MLAPGCLSTLVLVIRGCPSVTWASASECSLKAGEYKGNITLHQKMFNQMIEQFDVLVVRTHKFQSDLR